MVEVPERFYAGFDSAFPHESTLRDVTNRGQLLFAQAGLKNMVGVTAWSAARRVEAIGVPGSLAPVAASLFGNFNDYIAGIQAMQTVNVPGVLIQTAQAFSTIAAQLGAFQSVPIVGMILDFVVKGIEAGVSIHGYNNTVELEAFPMGYAKQADTEYTQSILDLHAGRDLTPIFLPVTDASGGVIGFNVEVEEGWTGKVTEVIREIFVPQGSATTNIGGLPNAALVPKGWEVQRSCPPKTRVCQVPWSAFRPSTNQAVLQSWQSVLSNTRACYLVDAKQVAAEWTTWQDNMQLWGWGTRYKGDQRRRIANLSRPPLLTTAERERIGNDGFRRLVPWWAMHGGKPYYGPMLGDVGAWAATVQLGRRQRQYLGTLTVAYCSENDPAFRNDPALADLLLERRQLLLSHPAAAQVRLSEVPDADFRQVLATRQGPGGLSGDTGPGSIGDIATADKSELADPMPPVLVSKPPSGAPFLGRSNGGAQGEPMKNAALLALLGFLLK